MDQRGPIDIGQRRSRIRRVLVATSLANEETPAIMRANEIAARFDAALHLVHVLPRGGRALADNPTVLREVIKRWVQSEASVELVGDNVHIEVGAPAAHIESVAARIRANLVVLQPSLRGSLRTTLALSGSMAGAVLFANPERRHGDVVAATDLRAPGYPVVEHAIRFASAFGRRVTLVHNMGTGADSAGRQLAQRLHDLERVTQGFPVVRTVNLARVHSTARAIEEIARASNADLVVVGARRRRGRTLVTCLESKRSHSVLAIPIPEETDS